MEAQAPAIFPKLEALALTLEGQISTGVPFSRGGRVRTIAAGHYTVSGLSEHVRLGEFVVHKSATGSHLGEVVRVEPDLIYVCPIEPGEPVLTDFLPGR